MRNNLEQVFSDMCDKCMFNTCLFTRICFNFVYMSGLKHLFN